MSGHAGAPRWSRGRTAAVLLALAALAVRAGPLVVWPWSEATAAHHTDEVFLPLEALAHWEGVTPREVGWPASTTRLALSAAYAADMLREERSALFAARSAPAAMERIAAWSARAAERPRRLFAIGRAYSVVVGMLAVLAIYRAADRWAGRSAALAAGGVTVLSPIAVSYSQFVLADMTGVLFAALAMGRWARPAKRLGEVACTGLLVGLAAASKHNFAVWLLPGLAWLAVSRGVPRLRAALLMIGSAAAAYLLLVPWAWTNPILFVKEFLGVVGEKVATGGEPFAVGAALRGLASSIHAMGWLASAGLLLGVVRLLRERRLQWLPIHVALLVGLLALAAARILHERYALMLLPAIAVCAGAAFSQLALDRSLRRRAAALGLLLALTVLTFRQLVVDQLAVGGPPASLQAYHWLRAHAEPGEKIAVYSNFPHRLPRTRAQLARLVSEFSGPHAYARKMRSNGYLVDGGSQPFASAVLCDERFATHWFLRELSIRRPDEGFEVFFYDATIKFGSAPEAEARQAFLDGLTDVAAGFDYFLTARSLPPPAVAAWAFTGPRAETLHLYARRGLASDAAGGARAGGLS